MNAQPSKVGELFFLLHPGEIQFSGYGLTVERGSAKRLVGLLMVDRPQVVSPAWLTEVETQYGRYELYPMTKTGERGIACQMWIAEASLLYVNKLPGEFTRHLQTALFPLLTLPPNPQLDVQWHSALRRWQSSFHAAAKDSEPAAHRQRQADRFDLGTVVGTPGALQALEEAGQQPQEFLQRHHAGDWGDLDEHDRAANHAALREGGRLFSAYSTRNGTRLWIITEWDRSVTTILLPSDY